MPRLELPDGYRPRTCTAEMAESSKPSEAQTKLFVESLGMECKQHPYGVYDVDHLITLPGGRDVTADTEHCLGWSGSTWPFPNISIPLRKAELINKGLEYYFTWNASLTSVCIISVGECFRANRISMELKQTRRGPDNFWVCPLEYTYARRFTQANLFGDAI